MIWQAHMGPLGLTERDIDIGEPEVKPSQENMLHVHNTEKGETIEKTEEVQAE